MTDNAMLGHSINLLVDFYMFPYSWSLKDVQSHI